MRNAPGWRSGLPAGWAVASDPCSTRRAASPESTSSVAVGWTSSASTFPGKTLWRRSHRSTTSADPPSMYANGPRSTTTWPNSPTPSTSTTNTPSNGTSNAANCSNASNTPTTCCGTSTASKAANPPDPANHPCHRWRQPHRLHGTTVTHHLPGHLRTHGHCRSPSCTASSTSTATPSATTTPAKPCRRHGPRSTPRPSPRPHAALRDRPPLPAPTTTPLHPTTTTQPHRPPPPLVPPTMVAQRTGARRRPSRKFQGHRRPGSGRR